MSITDDAHNSFGASSVSVLNGNLACKEINPQDYTNQIDNGSIKKLDYNKLQIYF